MNRGPMLATAALMLIVAVLVVAVIAPIFTETPGQPLTSLHRGRTIYKLIATGGAEGRPGEWPQVRTNTAASAFRSSTDVFRRLLETGSNTFDYSLFSLRGLASARTTNAAEFRSENNAWCIAANVDGQTPDGTPVIFTRNINVTNASQFVGPVAATLSDEAPYGRDVAVVVLGGGMVKNVRPEDTWEDVLDNVPPGNRPILRP